MKKLFTLLLAAACFTAIAQLDDGSIAPDFIATDIDGNEHHLYSYLEQGKSVIVCFMATWSGPDYSYHSSGVLQNVYEDYGPEGTNQLVVLLLESDDSYTTLDDLYGVGNATVGNFVEGITYPIIDNAESIFWEYGNTYYPTIYAVCPDMTLVQSGQSSYAEQVNLALDGCGSFVVGCTDPAACNYSSVAAADDGSCDYCFCGDGTTWVLSLEQCVPSGEACGNGTVWDEVTGTCMIDETFCSWQPDSDGDQLIGVSDLLMFLSVFGDTDLDQDGIFDSNDDCVGEYDECGVCNGSGPSIPVIESVEILYDSVYAEPIGQWLLFEVGADTTYQFVCDPEDEESPWQCGDPLEYQGYEYATVQIGSQCWFAENLRVDTYLNGDAISQFDGQGWASANEGGVSVYGEDGISSCVDYSPTIESCDPSEALVAFGRIYNWHAISDDRGLCPSDWHVPSDEDFMELEVHIGIDPDDVGANGWRGSNEGNYLKAQTGWHNGGNGSNDFGFDLVPAGARGTSGQYDNAGRNGYLWTSTSDGSSAYYRRIEAGNASIARGSYVFIEGYPARCIKD